MQWLNDEGWVDVWMFSFVKCILAFGLNKYLGCRCVIVH